MQSYLYIYAVPLLLHILTRTLILNCKPNSSLDLVTSKSVLAMHYKSADFGVDSSSRFPFTARTDLYTQRQTNVQTRLIAVPTPRQKPPWVVQPLSGSYRPIIPIFQS